jgi:hypothetical protein
VLTSSCNWCSRDNKNPKPFVCKSCWESYGDSYAESDKCRRRPPTRTNGCRHRRTNPRTICCIYDFSCRIQIGAYFDFKLDTIYFSGKMSLGSNALNRIGGFVRGFVGFEGRVVLKIVLCVDTLFSHPTENRIGI